MTAVEGVRSREELETFLGEALVPLRLGCHHADGGLWPVSLWYRYRDGRFQCATGRGSDLVAFLRENDAVAFEVSTNTPPYMGVRGNGSVSVAPDEDKEYLRSLLARYLGGTDNDLASFLLDGDREELRLTIEPERLYTWDFTDRMRDTAADSPAARQPEPGSPRE